VADLKLFRLVGGKATELVGTSFGLERSLQTLIEENMESLFGVRFLTSEHSTGKKHGGRIDSLGIDENGSPVIFEYKRATNENVINQGLFYLDWLMDHRAEFELLVLKKLGNDAASQIDWASPRLVCVASDFTRYDEHAIAQINRSIELVRYRDYSGDYLTLDLISSTSAAATGAGQVPTPVPATPSAAAVKTVAQLHAQAPPALKELYDSLEVQLLALGDDVTKIERQNYYAFRRIKNFACVEVHPQSRKLLVYLKVNPDLIELSPGFTRDVRLIGHFGTGDLEVTLGTFVDLTKAQDLLKISYEAS
jgi:predicted transport protein